MVDVTVTSVWSDAATIVESSDLAVRRILPTSESVTWIAASASTSDKWIAHVTGLSAGAQALIYSRAIDTAGNTSVETATLTLNVPIFVTNPTDLDLSSGVAVAYTASASSPGSESVSYSAVALADTMVFSGSATPVLTWTTPVAGGNYTAHLRAKNATSLISFDQVLVFSIGREARGAPNAIGPLMRARMISHSRSRTRRRKRRFDD